VIASTRRELIERHLPLVRAVARRFAGRDELDDLVQVGAIGLIKAVDRYDAAYGVSFAAFATPAIAGEIRHHLRDRSAPVRVPRRLQAEGLRVTAVALDGVAEPAGDPVGEADQRLVIGAALRRLHPRERQVVQLRFAEDLSQAQIAARIGLSQVHVSRTLRQALLRLHAELVTTPTSV
jgi:RNA polymerase sigma-B factor